MSTSITTRQTAGTGATVKGSPLTNTEVDNNFIGLNQAVQPTGGTAGQILAKIDATNFNSQWIDNYATQVKLQVKNATGSTLNKGAVVYISGAAGANALISLAQANGDSTSATTIGFLESTLATGDSGLVVVTGVIAGINTAAATEGDPVWLSPTTPGGVVYGAANKPQAPNHLVYLGTVTRAHATVGEIQVHISNGWEIEELHDVKITSKANNDIIQYDSTLGVWKNVTPATARTNLGLAIGTNVQAWDADLDAIAGLAGTSGLLKKTAANTWSLDTNTYLTGNQSITVSGDATGSGATAITLTLANSGVSAGTYTKVTVDAKGRVTTGASLASSDVTTALGYTPYNSSNPNGYTSNVGTVTAVTAGTGLTGGTITASGTIALATSGVTAGTYTKITVDTLGRATAGTALSSADLPTYTGTLTSSQVTTALGYTPLSNATSYLPLSGGTISGALSFPQNPVGTTYGNGVSATPPYRIEGGAGDNDGWRLYGESASTNTVSMVFEVIDDIETAGNEWVFRNKKTYGDYAATTPFRISGAGAAFVAGNTVLHAGNINSYAPTLTGTGASGSWGISVTGSAAKWTTARTLSFTGDATGSGSVDGSDNVATALTLANSGVTAGTYTKVTVDAKGRVTTGASLASADVTTALGFTPYNSTNPSGYTSNTGTVTSVSGTGTVSGLTLTGTVTGSGSLSLGGTLSASIDNITDEHRLFNNMGESHSTRTSFDAQGAASTVNFGWRFVQGSTNGPGVNSAGQYYSAFVGLGNDYAFNTYGMQLAIPRNVTNPYMAVRYEEGGAFGAWQKISAGYADSAGNASTVTNGVVTTGSYADPAWITSINYSKLTGTVPTWNQSTTGSAATLTTGRTIAMTGDVTYTSGSFNGSANVTGTATLATVNANVGTFGSASAVPVVTVDAKGRVTAVSTATVQGGQYLGTAATKAIAFNAQTIGENITIGATQNGLSAGPITINSGFTVTITSGGNWAIV